MRFMWTALAFLAVACASPATEQAAQTDTTTPPPALADILAQSPASDWRAIDPNNTIYMELPRGRVIIELAPSFAPNHVANIRALARANYYDGGGILRSQDNYVVQWGRPDEDPKPLGAGLESVAGEIARPRASLPFTPFADPDTYADEVGFSDGFPAARNRQETWMTHCYGIVGSARGDGLNSGNAGQLYVVNGQAPRHLDRNITLVGRVVQGMELLSSTQRGTEALGFYATAAERTLIRSIRVASDVPAAERTNLETLRTDSATWARVVDSRRTRRESFFANAPTGRLNICNIAAPVRAVTR
ncbi:peptidyl-prolyl cis-trans isomerase [alpha proteobacterium U9-1i]|nr:peptidyl-prolyl cis-trans isomerase [alpha proteobacterium U9-1i]